MKEIKKKRKKTEGKTENKKRIRGEAGLKQLLKLFVQTQL